MTEDEAKTKWCHRTISGPWSNCIASACMAWEWHKLKAPTIKGTGRLLGTSSGDDPTYWQEPPRPRHINEHWTWDHYRAVWTTDQTPEPSGDCGLKRSVAP